LLPPGSIHNNRSDRTRDRRRSPQQGCLPSFSPLPVLEPSKGQLSWKLQIFNLLNYMGYRNARQKWLLSQ